MSQTQQAHMGRRLGPSQWAMTYSLQPYEALVCRLMVNTLIIHVITWIATHFPIPEGRRAEFAWLVDP